MTTKKLSRDRAEVDSGVSVSVSVSVSPVAAAAAAISNDALIRVAGLQQANPDRAECLLQVSCRHVHPRACIYACGDQLHYVLLRSGQPASLS